MKDKNVFDIHEYHIAKQVVSELPEVMRLIESSMSEIKRDEYRKYKAVEQLLEDMRKALRQLDHQYETQANVVEHIKKNPFGANRGKK